MSTHRVYTVAQVQEMYRLPVRRSPGTPVGCIPISGPIQVPLEETCSRCSSSISGSVTDSVQDKEGDPRTTTGLFYVDGRGTEVFQNFAQEGETVLCPDCLYSSPDFVAWYDKKGTEEYGYKIREVEEWREAKQKAA